MNTTIYTRRLVKTTRKLVTSNNNSDSNLKIILRILLFVFP
jgi:hypothetical protein